VHLARVDLIGWVTISVAILWICFSYLSIQIPWLTNALPQSILLVLGALAIYLHRVLEEIRYHTIEKNAELVIGSDEVYRAATRLIQESPPSARFWATSIWLYSAKPAEAPGYRGYSEVLLRKLSQDKETQYLRAFTARTAQNWQIAKQNVLETLPLPNAQAKFYFENPLVLDCLIGEKEAILGIPDRGSFPHLRSGIVIRDPQMVDSLRQWYQDFIWNSSVDKLEVKNDTDLQTIEQRNNW
jgi:hypothetical protein